MSPLFRRLACGGMTAALIAVAAAAPASAAEVNRCAVTGMTPRSVIVGLSDVWMTFRVTGQAVAGAELPAGTRCDDVWAVVDHPGTEDEIVVATHDVPRNGIVASRLINAAAGPAPVTAIAFTGAQDEIPGSREFNFSILRRSTWGSTFNVGPESAPTPKGGTLKVVATLGRVDWDKKRYAGYAGRSVWVQFRKAGTTTFVNVKNVKTGTGGKVSTTVKATGDGAYRIVYTGNSVTGNAVSHVDAIDVK